MSATLTGTRGWLRDRARERESDEEAAGGRRAFPLAALYCSPWSG